MLKWRKQPASTGPVFRSRTIPNMFVVICTQHDLPCRLSALFLRDDEGEESAGREKSKAAADTALTS